jgi:hypothetical protein
MSVSSPEKATKKASYKQQHEGVKWESNGDNKKTQTCLLSGAVGRNAFRGRTRRDLDGGSGAGEDVAGAIERSAGGVEGEAGGIKRLACGREQSAGKIEGSAGGVHGGILEKAGDVRTCEE